MPNESKSSELSDPIPQNGIPLHPKKIEWKEYKLGEVANLSTRKMPISEVVSDNYISTENMIENKGGVKQASSIPGTGNATKYSVGDILISNIRPYFKKIWMANRNGGCSNDVLCLVPNEELVNRKYLYYTLCQDVFFDYVMLGSKGCKMPRGDKSHIMNWRFVFPPLLEQKRIASILGSLDDKIDLLHRQNATLEAMAETLFRHHFIENPNPEWKEVPLSAYGKIVCGKTPSKKESKYFGGAIPFIKIPDMHNKVFVFDTEDSLTEEGLSSQMGKTLPPQSIAVSCIATVGLVVLNAKKAQTNQQINSIIPDRDKYRYFLYLSLKNMYEELNAMASGGTATLNLNTRNFSEILLAHPNDGCLEQFHGQVSLFFKKIFVNEIQIKNLSILRNSLIKNLLQV